MQLLDLLESSGKIYLYIEPANGKNKIILRVFKLT